MDNPKVAMIGAGAMGGVIAGALASGGADLTIIDTDTDHVDAINADGLRVEGLKGPQHVRAITAPDAEAWADLAVIMVPTTEIEAAALTAASVLKPDGAAISCQNGLGNMEALVGVLGRWGPLPRVLGRQHDGCRPRSLESAPPRAGLCTASPTSSRPGGRPSPASPRAGMTPTRRNPRARYRTTR